MLRAIARRDEAALKTLIERYKRLLFTIAWEILGDGESAESVLWDAFVQCWKHAGSYESERAGGGVRGWLIMITRRCAITAFRPLRRQREHESPAPALADWDILGKLQEADETEDVNARLDRAPLYRQVRACLAKLTKEQREPIALACFRGLTHQEISRLLSTPLGTINTRIRTGMQRLRDCLPPNSRAEVNAGD